MRKILLHFAIAGISLLAACKGNSQMATTDNQKVSVSESEVKSLTEFLASDDLKGRQTGTEGIDRAAERIEKIFEESGVQPYYETYRDSFEIEGRQAFNVMGFVEGNDENLRDEIIIIGAHYDHIGEGEEVDGDKIANGANDNAAGTVAVVELAKHFAKIDDTKRSLLFILFSAEEMGLQGSKYAAEKLKSEGLDLYTMLNFEMIGVPMEGKDYVAYITGFEASNLAEKFNEYSGEQVAGFLPQAKEYNLFQRSDNYPFYQEFNVPAQTFCTFDFTNYEYYHHVDDETEELDFAHMTKVIESVTPGIHKMANTEEKEIKLTE